MGTRIEHDILIDEQQTGQRLDQALAALLPDYSRSRIQQWIREGAVRLEGTAPRPRDKVAAGQQVTIRAELEEEQRVSAEPIPLRIQYEDRHLLVIDKPAGLVVHPGAGNREGTLQNALLHHDPQLAELPRSGIVHRLDKDTSGLMVVARSLAAHTALVAQLQARSVRREYLALVNGCPVAGGTVEAPIGRHPRDRKRMAVVERGRPATTHYRVEERLAAHTLLRCFLETGRTHQIRVHMAHAGYPLVGDPVYGGRLRLPPRATEAQRQALRAFQRQALHAARLALDHPESGERLSWEAPLPEDMAALLACLRS
ncbi:23S rRNA pseudouridine(1911/1915/1917) synthase RluD [Alkalilimnicola ehrlichii MLHE-1]|uniref:Pseudouridine synthase n=1 Tax=Alkalilimnicola ehrlichii (strain ATCC BAA-1101 / DSM 17681 / MLHE-1) TaxID=187272 RepID=Q0A5J5_ALKEH|nr:23S rRNA pseudouridine(1911/1915/1917) synthase RluD [Alkalilimnicola ehrlichii]ABI57892.1 ribosomal large subunit pseudouridine synthase D [Alkalilimnicola ehrlichii MLHE-1]